MIRVVVILIAITVLFLIPIVEQNAFALPCHLTPGCTTGYLYVPDTSRVLQYDSSGNLLNQHFVPLFPGFNFNWSVAFDSSGNLYTANRGPMTVRQHDNAGNLLDADFVNSDGEPTWIAFDSSDNLYVTRGGGPEVRKYDSLGNLLSLDFAPGTTSACAMAFDTAGNFYVIDGFIVKQYSSFGTLLNADFAKGLVGLPTSLAFDSSGNLYVAQWSLPSTIDDRITKHDSSGNILDQSYILLGDRNPEPNITFDSAGNLYVTDPDNDAIRKYDSTGNLIDSLFANGLFLVFPHVIAFGHAFPDSDGDGFPNSDDPQPNDPCIPNPNSPVCFPPNNQVSMEAGDQTEPSIAVNPLDPHHIIIGAIDVPADNCRFYVSFDGGDTFVSDLLILASPFDSCTDPSVAFGPDGKMYYAGFLQNGEPGDPGYSSGLGVWEMKVPPFGAGPHFNTELIESGGQTCSGQSCNAEAALQPHVDKPYLTIDPRFGAIHLAWNTLNLDCTFNTGGCPRAIQAARLDINGVLQTSFQNQNTLSTSFTTNNFGAHPAFDIINLDVYVSWRQFQRATSTQVQSGNEVPTNWISENHIRVARSTDGGQTWQTDVQIADIGPQDPAADVQGTLRNTRIPVTDVPSQTRNQFDPNTFRDNPFVVFQDDLPAATPTQDVWISRSNDGGATWRAPNRINDVTAGDQFFPWMCIAENGRIDVAWLDRRDDPNNFLYDVYYASSLDGGETFSSNEKVTTVSSDPRNADLTNAAGGGFIGDYMGVACTNARTYIAWPDMRDGVANQNIYSARIIHAPFNLVDNGDGTVSDFTSGLMWLQDANYADTSGAFPDGEFPSWTDATQWAENLAFAGHDDWRLPETLEPDPSCDSQDPFNGIIRIVVTCSGSDMGNFQWNEGITSRTPGPFINVQGGNFYWSDTEWAGNPAGRAWVFKFSSGEQGPGNKASAAVFAWAVRGLNNQSVEAATGTGEVNFAPSSGTIQSLDAVAENTLPNAGKPVGVNFPHGFASWTVTGLELGETITITMVFPSNIPSPAQYWKVIGGTWVDVTSLLGDDDGDNVLTLSITDGGLGDADGLVNGEITDPGGVSIGSTTSPDSDMDGIPDDQDPDPNDPCNPNLRSPACDSDSDHYFGYVVNQKTIPTFVPIQIGLSDQFGDAIYDVVKPIMMYNPAKKNGEPVNDKVTHLKAYKIRGPHEPVTDILLTNQFEQLVVNIKRVDSILVPTAKSHDGPTDPLTDEPVDHFKCYKIDVVGKIGEGFVSKKKVVVVDKNFDEKRKVKITGKPLLCNPVAKFDPNSMQELSTIKNPDTHLTCYKVKPKASDLGHTKIRFDTNNQFGPEDLITKKHDVVLPSGKILKHMLCVPTLKQIITNG